MRVVYDGWKFWIKLNLWLILVFQDSISTAFMECRSVTAFILMVPGVLHLNGRPVMYYGSILNNITDEEK